MERWVIYYCDKKLTREVEIVIKETITQIEARIEKAESLNDAKKKELLDLPLVCALSFRSNHPLPFIRSPL